MGYSLLRYITNTQRVFEGISPCGVFPKEIVLFVLKGYEEGKGKKNIPQGNILLKYKFFKEQKKLYHTYCHTFSMTISLTGYHTISNIITHTYCHTFGMTITHNKTAVAAVLYSSKTFTAIPYPLCQRHKNTPSLRGQT